VTSDERVYFLLKSPLFIWKCVVLKHEVTMTLKFTAGSDVTLGFPLSISAPLSLPYVVKDWVVLL
jgi:hypothetical protein